MTHDAPHHEEKELWRRLILAARASMTPDHRAHASARIAAHVLTLREVQHPATVLTYESRPDEVATAPLIAALLARGCRVIVPTSKGRSAQPTEWHEIHEDGTRTMHDASVLDAVDVFLLPGLVFDYDGTRIGFGAGFFDKVLSDAPANARVCALAFACQVTDEQLPRAPHDQPMNVIVTEDGIVEVVARDDASPHAQ